MYLKRRVSDYNLSLIGNSLVGILISIGLAFILWEWETRVDILLNWTTRRDSEGNITGAIGFGQDVTEIKKYQAQVIQASKLATLGEMSTSVAHELNQPLHTILMAASNINERIESGKFTPALLQKKLQRIMGQVERASLIINHMRMFGRIDDQQPVLFDPEKALQGAISLMGHGTGLGLSISYGIIRDMQGSLTAENTDKGLRVNLIIPVT